MKEIDDNCNICPHCGYEFRAETDEVYYIKPGNELNKRYTIGRVIGFGGFGIVYKAWDNNLMQVVAVKEYFPTVYVNRVSDSNEVAVFDKKNVDVFNKGKNDFLLEARTIAKYNKHPNIVHIYDFFEENGTSYFVMEYIDGYTLKDYISEAKRQGKVLTVNSAIHITKGVLNALEQTHSDGIIHRDIKPSNIFITEEGDVKIFDFGAARLTDAAERTRTVIITPGYAPPEQYQVNSVQGTYTDIYAIGAMLYEMLTGIKPEESINRKVIDEVEKPSVHNSKIPHYLDSIIMRAMAIRPEIRFKNVQIFKNAIELKKDVRDAKAEIKRRKILKAIRIGLALTLLLGVSVLVVQRYYKSYRNATLTETSVVVWIPRSEDESVDTYDLYNSMLQEFNETYPQVNVELQIINDNEYNEELFNSLIMEDSGPDLFINPMTNEDISMQLAEIDNLFDDLDLDTFFLLSKYRLRLEDVKACPIAFDVPVKYENAMTDELPDGSDYESFVKGEANYLGYVSDYDAIQADMAGKYVIDDILDVGRIGRFVDYWSINKNSSEERQIAAQRIIYYFLSDNAQEIYTIENAQGLPLNKEVWEIYVDINSDFNFIENQLSDIEFN